MKHPGHVDIIHEPAPADEKAGILDTLHPRTEKSRSLCLGGHLEPPCAIMASAAAFTDSTMCT
jgi:hypothetical protein